MNYKQLEDANKSIITTDIKGKEYAEVNQRIKAFRMLEPNGCIETEIISLDNGVCVIKATIKNEQGAILGIGHAYEKEGSTFINKTSYIENCETSAVGRALGMCGIGIDTSVASYEEVANAIENQKPKAPLNQQLLNEAARLQIDLNKVATYYKKPFEALTDADVQQAIAQKQKALGGQK
jgi:hypothetical protein